MTHLYNCRHDGDQFRITKFDTDMNVEASYLLNAHECECPAAARDTCRHRQMLPKFIARGAVDTEWFYDFDRGGWVQLALPGAEPGGGREQDGDGYDVPEGSGDEEQDGLESANAEPSVADVAVHARPHSVAVSTGDFDSPSDGSNPSVVATTIDRRGR